MMIRERPNRRNGRIGGFGKLGAGERRLRLPSAWKGAGASVPEPSEELSVAMDALLMRVPERLPQEMRKLRPKEAARRLHRYEMQLTAPFFIPSFGEHK